MRYVILILSVSLFAHAAPKPTMDAGTNEAYCTGARYSQASAELHALYKADQADRRNISGLDKIALQRLSEKDRFRVRRVAEIFAQGCLKSASDYHYAAVVFQHGEVPDHFYQAYVWAYKSFEMGNSAAGVVAAYGIDRYMMAQGYRQLYGTQVVTEGDPHSCYCIWPMDESFPEEKRRKLKAQSRSEMMDWVARLNSNKIGCANSYCTNVKAEHVPGNVLSNIW